MENLPVTDLPEIAFVGRSNAGKSTAINTLCQQRQLAFASKTPGRTQHINFFAVGPKNSPTGLLVDLPGYGYAAVAKSDKKRWQLFLAQYLAERGPLVGLILLADSRLGLTETDLSLLAFMAPASVPLHVLLTKADKLNRQEGQRAAQAARDQLAQHAQAVGMTAPISLQLFSATKLSGIESASQLIESWLDDAARPVEGAETDLAACRTLVVESENGAQQGQFLPDLQTHSPAMGQKDGKKWTAATHLQPTIPKPDRLLESGSASGLTADPE